ncbi:MAG: hypothetical protein WAN48_01890 [Actinomycetes bacterium]
MTTATRARRVSPLIGWAICTLMSVGLLLLVGAMGDQVRHNRTLGLVTVGCSVAFTAGALGLSVWAVRYHNQHRPRLVAVAFMADQG